MEPFVAGHESQWSTARLKNRLSAIKRNMDRLNKSWGYLNDHPPADPTLLAEFNRVKHRFFAFDSEAGEIERELNRREAIKDMGGTKRLSALPSVGSDAN